MNNDDERARRLLDWILDRSWVIALHFFVFWVALSIMCFGIVTASRNGSDAARRTQQILEGNDREAKDRSTRSVEDRARLELVTRALYDAQQCVTEKLLLTPIENRDPDAIKLCFPPIPDPPPGFLPKPGG